MGAVRNHRETRLETSRWPTDLAAQQEVRHQGTPLATPRRVRSIYNIGVGHRPFSPEDPARRLLRLCELAGRLSFFFALAAKSVFKAEIATKTVDELREFLRKTGKELLPGAAND